MLLTDENKYNIIIVLGALQNFAARPHFCIQLL